MIHPGMLGTREVYVPATYTWKYTRAMPSMLDCIKVGNYVNHVLFIVKSTKYICKLIQIRQNVSNS